MKILVIAPHPDDETIGVGGTLLKHKKNNDEIYWYIATAVNNNEYSENIVKIQRDYIEAVAKKYEFRDYIWAKFLTTTLDTIELNKIISSLTKTIKNINPDIIYTVGEHDVHTDHQAIFKSLMTGIKSFNLPGNLKRILEYEVISSTDVYQSARASVFIPNVFSDISDFIEEKLKIMSVYKREIHPYPLPRSLESIRALNRYRGSIIGAEYAESFKLIFEKF